MLNWPSFMPNDVAILVLGAINAKKEDRRLDYSEVRPFQILIDREIKTVTFFNSWEVIGISSLAWPQDEPMILYVTKPMEMDTNIVKIDLKQQNVKELNIANLKDVHEMIIYDKALWIANTGFDEAVTFDIFREQIISRVNLSSYRNGFTPSYNIEGGEIERVDRFHLNQIFQGINGELYGLVHHVFGKQILRHIDKEQIKSQGDGGVINLSNGSRVPLGLKSPHTVRIINGDYWVMDSGNFKINIYTPNWKLKGTLKTRGYGRGADLSKTLGLFYAGISETRKRYLKLIQGGSPNMIQMFDVDSKKPIGEILIETGIEQINNVYIIDREVGLALLAL